MMQADHAVPAIPLTTPPADIDSTTEIPPKKKIKREYESKTENSKPNNPRGGIAATISNLCNGITDFQKQLRAKWIWWWKGSWYLIVVLINHN